MAPVDEPTEALAQRAADGDQRALDQLLRVIEPQVMARCHRMLPNRLDAEEACQDALVAVARRIGSFEGRARFSTWLYQVATNASLDTYRRLKRRAGQIGSGSVLEDRPGTDSTSVLAGTRVDLLEALEQLDPRFGEPVVMRDVFGLDYAEISRQLDIPQGTVKSRIHEGRKTLQWLLSR